MSTHRASTERGYTLIELSIVIVILGLLISNGLQLYQRRSEAQKQDETLLKMQEIAIALQGFYDRNGFLPCPAPGNATPTTAIEVPAGGGTSYFAGEAVAYDTANDACHEPQGGVTTNLDGAVPTRTLNLSDDMMLDAWGRKIGYHLASGLGERFDFIDDVNFPGDISVEDATGAELTPIGTDGATTADTSPYGAAFLLISYGLNGGYGWTQAGTQRLAPASAPLEVENGDGDAVYRQTEVNTDFGGSNNFDDLVIYRTKLQIKNPKRMVSPIHLPSYICADARAIADSISGAANPLNNYITFDAARAGIFYQSVLGLVELCEKAAPPLEDNCGLNLIRTDLGGGDDCYCQAATTPAPDVAPCFDPGEASFAECRSSCP